MSLGLGLGLGVNLTPVVGALVGSPSAAPSPAMAYGASSHTGQFIGCSTAAGPTSMSAVTSNPYDACNVSQMLVAKADIDRQLAAPTNTPSPLPLNMMVIRLPVPAQIPSATHLPIGHLRVVPLAPQAYTQSRMSAPPISTNPATTRLQWTRRAGRLNSPTNAMTPATPVINPIPSHLRPPPVLGSAAVAVQHPHPLAPLRHAV